MNYQEYISTELWILVPVLYLIGLGLKKSALPDKWIPVTLGAISIVLSAVWVLATSEISSLKELACAFFTAVTQGVLTAGASVYANQLFLQSRKEE